MKEILIFAGTTEGRTLSEGLAAAGIAHTICVATQYGEIVLKEHPLVKVRQGRMNQDEIKDFISKQEFVAVVDATHPYAERVSENIRLALHETNIPYLRLKRDIEVGENYDNCFFFGTNEACAKALETVEGNILLTTGSKELAKYCISEAVKNRLYVRVLPGMESLTLCMEQGIVGKQILAMQGPFSTELNEALIHQFQIACLVTKQSGTSGGYQEKLEAAKKAGIPVFVIGQSTKEEGLSFSEVGSELEKICGQEIKLHKEMEIILAGIGMGSKNSLTKEVADAIKEADILLGAKRMIEESKVFTYGRKAKKQPFYQAKQIIPYLKEVQKNKTFRKKIKVVVLFSGDSGFYSGCQTLYTSLIKEIKEGGLMSSVCIMPGVSSISYMASCIGESYQDAAILSMHGKELPNIAQKVRSKKKTFLLLSGAEDVRKIGKELTKAGMYTCEVVLGYQLSYPEQQIRKLTPKQCCEVKEDGLYTCLIYNPDAINVMVTHGISDPEFIRDKVPMTKEEVREVSICKLKLQKDSVVYDIGSGTGSIAVEIAGLSDEIQVFAIEQKEEAVSLIKQNKEKFKRHNLEVIKAKAPEGLEKLPTPTHAFIGGSSGNMKAILSALYDLNPRMRIVINAISMETICEIKEVLEYFSIKNEEVVQMQVNRAKKAGNYHLMQAENPVLICAFDFD